MINPYLHVLSGLDTYLLRDAFDCYTFKYPTNDNLIFRSITYYRLKLSQFKIFLTYRFILNFVCLQAQPQTNDAGMKLDR